MNKLNIIFVCGRNQWRSPTAGFIYKDDSRFSVKSAGISSKSPHKISAKDIEWADLIMVFEDEYSDRILEVFADYDIPTIINLDIADEYKYKYMDSELVDLIKDGVEGYLAED
jgi:predicted protein tyrosine phosphatase